MRIGAVAWITRDGRGSTPRGAITTGRASSKQRYLMRVHRAHLLESADRIVPDLTLGDIMRTKKLAALFVLVSAVAVFAQQPAFKRTVLQTAELSIAGREAVTGKAEIPVGIAAGPHTHPGEEIGYVLEGTVTIEIDGTKKTLKAGDAFAIPAGKVHNAINAGQTQVTIVSTYIVEKGKPLATPVKQ